ncbi:tail fiber domain-containing protein [Limosilactobacillus balticus]|uniref:tail fiber domain-containing protein n=1 Tax=Limosilactobacillus balticus TaxID=2759747 RepID=UPI003991D08F
MSNTSSNKTSKTNQQTVKVIVGEIGRDTKTGILGRGYSYDNGATFHVTDTMFGRLYDKDDGERMWPNMAHKVADEIKSATADLPNVRKQADEAVKFAESAIAASKVNSDAIVAQSSAVVEAKSAMDSATAEIQQLKANAASDVAQIRADVAQVQNEVDTVKAANSASVDKLKSDIGLAQKDLDNVHDSLTKAQSAVEQNQKLINDSVTKINSDIAQNRQDIVTAQQANDDLAKQLDTYSKEAQEQGKTIKTIQDNQDGFSITIADVKGDVTKVSDTVDGLSAGLKDAQGNIASVKAQADQLNATLTDHSKDIAQLTATAKELSSTLEDANGRLSKVEQTASEQSTTLSDLQGNLTQVKQTADNLVTTLKDAQGNIDQIKQDAKGTLEQLSNAQGDIAALQKDVSGIKLTIADHDKNIHTLQADSKTLKDDMADAKGNISSLQKTSTSLVSEFKDHDGRISKTEQTASTLANEFSDQQGHLSRVEQTAQGTQQTVANQQGQINTIKTDVSGIHQTITGQGNQIATINVTLNGLNTKYEGVEKSGDELAKRLDNLKVGTSNLLHHSDTFDGWDKGNLVTITSDKYLNGTIAVLGNTGIAGGSQIDTHLDGPYDNQPVTWTVYAKADNVGDKLHTELWGGGGYTDQPLANNWQIYQFTGQRNINHPDFYLWGCQGNKGNIYVALPFAVVGNTIGTWSPNTDDVADKITTNSTQIDQNKKAIALKADQSTVNNLSGEVSQNKAQLKVQADQISSKVSSTEYQTLKDKVNNLQVGGDNLVSDGDADAYNATPWPNTHFQTHPFYYNSTRKMFNLNTSSKTELTADGPWFPVIAGHQYTLYFNGFMSNNVSSYDVWLLGKAADKDGGWTNSFNVIGGERLSPSRNCIITRTFTVPNDWNNFVAYLRFDNNGSTDGQDSVFFFNEISLKEGNVNTGYSASPNDAITLIKKNVTAIDQTNKAITLKADQTEVDNVKNTSQQLSSRLDVMEDQIKSKVTSTDVNNIVDGKGYATTSTVQSLVDQKAGTLNESITNLEGKFNSSSSVNLAEKTNQGTTNWMCDPGTGTTNLTEVNINGVRGVRFNNTRKTTSWWVAKYVLNLDYFEPNQDYIISFDIRTSSDNFNQGGMLNIARGDSSHPYLANTSFKTNFKQNQLTHVSCTGHSYSSLDKNGETFYLNCAGLGQCDWVDIVNFKIARGKIDKGYSPAPSDNATVTQLQSVTASIDGLQSRVTNYQNDTSSKYTQLSNLMQSKVGMADFNNLKRSVDMQTLDSADINNMKTNGHYFVRNLANNPIGGWVYVDVTGNGNDRIRQDVYQDSGLKHKYRRWFGTYWTGWEEGATYTEITQLQDAVNLRVQKGELLSQINLTAGNTLIQSNKLYLDASSVVFSGRAFIPSAAIAELDADKLTFYGNGSKASIGAGIAQYDQDRVKSTINLQYDGGFEIHSSNNLGSILTMHDDTVRLASKSQVYGAGSGHPLNQQYSGFWASKNYALMNAVDSEGKTTGWTIGSSNSQGYRAYLYDSSTTNQPANGVGIGTQRFDVYAGNSNIFLGPDKAELRGNDYATVHGNDHTFIEGGNEQIYIHNGEVCIGMPGHENDKTSVHLRVFGWADFNGWMNVMGLSQTSLLSTKTRVAPLDTKVALDKIASADVRTYQFKSDVAQGKTKRHASVIIDDVHDVAEYYTPEEFISENRKGRDDGDIVGYLMGAVQELKKQLDKVKEKI